MTKKRKYRSVKLKNTVPIYALELNTRPILQDLVILENDVSRFTELLCNIHCRHLEKKKNLAELLCKVKKNIFS